MARPPRRTAPTIEPAQQAAIAAALHETRSCVVVVLNRTAHELVLAAATPLRGGFQPAPPARIAAHAAVAFGTQSAAGQGGAGCAAIVTYRAGASFTLSLRFDVPYAGRNAAAATISGPGSETVAVTGTSGAGHVRVAIEFVVSPHPLKTRFPVTSSTTRALPALLALVLAAALGAPASAGSPAPIGLATTPPSGSMVISIMPTNILPNPDLRSISVRDGIARLTYQGADGAQAVVRVHVRGERFARKFAPGTRIVDVTGSGAGAKLVYVSPGDPARHTLPLSMNLQRTITKSRVTSDRR